MENFEMKENAETLKGLSSEKQELLVMEKEERYVFHGTAVDVDLLNPQQAIDTERGPDGDPAVFASPSTDFAIFHAIVNGKNFPEGIVSSSGATSHDDGSYELKFALPKNSLSLLSDTATGWVYVFDKKNFVQVEGRSAEYVSRVAVQPLQKIRVAKRDLPANIGVLAPRTDAHANAAMNKGSNP